GECLSALGIAVLTRTSLAESIRKLDPVIFTRALLHAGQSPPIEVPLPRPMWGVSRARLDAALLDAARDAGASIIQPARCEAVIASDRPLVRWRCLRTNSVHERSVNWAFIADGKGAAMPGGVALSTTDLGIKAHFTSVDGPRDAIELFGVNGHYGGL